MVVPVQKQGIRAEYSSKPLDSFDFSPWKSLPLPPVPAGESERRETPTVGLGERLVALGLIACASPLMLMVAAAIKIECPAGSIFYLQERVGLDRRRRSHESPRGRVEKRKKEAAGCPFRIWKFRSMKPDAEKKTGPVWAAVNDSRLTAFGRTLRLLHLDELPQLFNVLRGEMTLIGPRPERPHFVAQFSEEIEGYVDRLKVIPGITGLAQVEREYDSDENDVRTKLKYDLFYVQNQSRTLDLKILIKTLDVILHRKGAH